MVHGLPVSPLQLLPHSQAILQLDSAIFFGAPIDLVLTSGFHSMCLVLKTFLILYEVWNFNSGNYLFTTDTK